MITYIYPSVRKYKRHVMLHSFYLAKDDRSTTVRDLRSPRDMPRPLQSRKPDKNDLPVPLDTPKALASTEERFTLWQAKTTLMSIPGFLTRRKIVDFLRNDQGKLEERITLLTFEQLHGLESMRMVCGNSPVQYNTGNE